MCGYSQVNTLGDLSLMWYIVSNNISRLSLFLESYIYPNMLVNITRAAKPLSPNK